MTRVLITGVAGFIGFHLGQTLLTNGLEVLGVDNLNNYYDVGLKQARLEQLLHHTSFQFVQMDVADRPSIADLFARYQPAKVVHLAAQAGVRYSLTNPHAYVDSNLVGFTNILEGCRHANVRHLVFASSSSVYGANTKIPFATHDRVDHPISLYAATKRSNELMAYAYSHLYHLPTTGLRFFTVYGPWGRPDMAYFSFTRAILQGKPIQVYNYGKMRRDFTYIDDIVEGIVRVLDRPPEVAQADRDTCHDRATTILEPAAAPYRLYNIGNNQPVELLQFIETLERCLGQETEKQLLPMQPGDVLETYADIDDLMADVGFRPHTPLEVGLTTFVEWYRSYYAL